MEHKTHKKRLPPTRNFDPSDAPSPAFISEDLDAVISAATDSWERDPVERNAVLGGRRKGHLAWEKRSLKTMQVSL